MTGNFKRWPALAVSLVLLVTPLRAQFAYVTNFHDNTVSGYSITSNGALTPVAGSPFAAGIAPRSVAVDPTGKFVYVVNLVNQGPAPSIPPSTVSAFSIASNGGLTPVSGSPFVSGKASVSLAVDPTGKFVYVANEGEGTVSAYSIGSSGALTPVAGSPFAAESGPTSVAVDPTGKFAYVTNINDNTVLVYSIASNGALMAVSSSESFGADPFSVAVNPTGKFAYVVNQGPAPSIIPSTVSAFSIASNGALTPVPGSPFVSGKGSLSVAVDPTGKFAYVANDGGNNVSAFSIASNGALTPVPGSPFTAGTAPVSVAVDPTGKFAYVTNSSANNVSAYSIASNGALESVPGSPFTAGGEPFSVAITPLVPFASSFAKLEISKKGFDLNESFTLGANSNGINPVTEKVTLQIGTFSVTIPAGSFKQNPNGRFAFDGVINGVSLELQIVPLGNNMFTFKAEGTGVNLSGLKNPVTVVLTIGIDPAARRRSRIPVIERRRGNKSVRFLFGEVSVSTLPRTASAATS